MFLRKLLPNASRDTTSVRSDNPFTEILVLAGHKNFVRHLVLLDDHRLASSDDSGTIIIWDYEMGSLLHTLGGEESGGLPTEKGHNLPIRCLLCLDSDTLVSGSSDKTIKMWNTRTGECFATLDNHTGSVMCLALVKETKDTNGVVKFCSGGNDKQICLRVWNPATRQVSLLATVTRSEDENLNCMIVLGANTVVTGSNSAIITYRLDRCVTERSLTFHRESVQCLVELQSPYNCFVSGSLDGAIVIWNSTDFTQVMILNNPADYYDMKQHSFIYCIRCLLPVGDHFLIAAIGCGYIIYDLQEKRKIDNNPKANSMPISSIIPLCNNTRFVTSSYDSTVSLWNSPTAIVTASGEPGPRNRRQGHVGSMQAHSGAIMSMVKLNNHSFATCSDDGTIVVWKDEVQQSEWRNAEAALSLAKHHNPSFGLSSSSPTSTTTSAASPNPSSQELSTPAATPATTTTTTTTTFSSPSLPADPPPSIHSD
ncbi:Wdr41 protein [Pelomyxa schiedti]|nr:Wdr41 protein [Pelomyxa schiedti]